MRVCLISSAKTCDKFWTRKSWIDAQIDRLADRFYVRYGVAFEGLVVPDARHTTLTWVQALQRAKAPTNICVPCPTHGVGWPADMIEFWSKSIKHPAVSKFSVHQDEEALAVVRARTSVIESADIVAMVWAHDVKDDEDFNFYADKIEMSGRPLYWIDPSAMRVYWHPGPVIEEGFTLKSAAARLLM